MRTIIINIVLSLTISALIIYIVTNIFGEKESVGTAFMAALIGAIIYAGAYFFIGTGLIAAIIGGITWLIALRSLYRIGWGKSALIAVVLWIVISVFSFLPTVMGPL